MISDTLDEIVFKRALFKRGFSSEYAVSLGNLVIDKLEERFAFLLKDITFCLEVRENQYFFERHRPEIADVLDQTNERLSVCLFFDGKFKRIFTVRRSDTPGTTLERAYTNLASIFFEWDTPYRRGLIEEHKGDYKNGLIQLGLNYQWDLISFSDSEGSTLRGRLKGHSDIHYPPNKHNGFKLTAVIFRNAIASNSTTVMEHLLTVK